MTGVAAMRCVLLEPVHPAALALLAAEGEVVQAPDTEEATAIALARDADAMLTRGRGRISRAVLAAGDRLRVVARCGVGIDNIDSQAAGERGIPVINAPDSTTSTVAEHALLLLLAAARRLPALDTAARGGGWAIREGYQGLELAGKQLGLIGLGHIGRRVAELATAFGMGVAYWSRRSREERYRYEDLDALLASSPFVSLHLALTPATRGLLDGRRLALLPRGAVLVNTARGGLVDEGAVAAALHAGQLAAYATDVLASEPPAAGHPLLDAPSLLLTPHCAGLTDRAFEVMCVEAATNVLRVLHGEQPPLHTVANLALVRQHHGW